MDRQAAALVTAVMGVVTVLGLAYEYFREKPEKPVPVRESDETLTEKDRDRMRKEAMDDIGIDCLNAFNLAFCGDSGAGKSTLINVSLELKDTDPGAAPTDVAQTTRKATKYNNSDFPNLFFWDNAGGGTVEHPAETYFQDKKLYAFDVIFIIYAARLTALDVKIFCEAQIWNTPAIFVRNKCDIDLDNEAEKLDAEKITSEMKKNYKMKVRNELMKEIPDELKQQVKLFIVSKKYFRGRTQEKREEYALDEEDLARCVWELDGIRKRLGSHRPRIQGSKR